VLLLILRGPEWKSTGRLWRELMGLNPNQDSSGSGLLELSGPSSENRILLVSTDDVCLIETRLLAGGGGGSIPGRLRMNI